MYMVYRGILNCQNWAFYCCKVYFGFPNFGISHDFEGKVGYNGFFLFRVNGIPTIPHISISCKTLIMLQIWTKMKRFSCLAILFCLIVSSDANCEQTKVKRCIEQYVEELQHKKPDISSHCDRLQVIHGTLI